jgi:hypothetical protein
MNPCAGVTNVAVFECSVAGSVRVDLAISFQAGPPEPAKGSQQFEVLSTAVPVVEADVLWREPSVSSRF